MAAPGLLPPHRARTRAHGQPLRAAAAPTPPRAGHAQRIFVLLRQRTQQVVAAMPSSPCPPPSSPHPRWRPLPSLRCCWPGAQPWAPARRRRCCGAWAWWGWASRRQQRRGPGSRPSNWPRWVCEECAPARGGTGGGSERGWRLGARQPNTPHPAGWSRVEQAAAPDKVPGLRLQRAAALEQEGRLPEAEQAYLEAGAPREAMHMWVPVFSTRGAA